MRAPRSRVRTGAQLWCALVVIAAATVADVASLNGPNVCMVKQKYNITKRVKYRAPMSVRTYEWCFSMPPRCSRWNTEMRDLTRLETEERTAEVAVCCPGYKMRDVSCVPICPYGKTGPACSDDCPEYKWGPNCVLNCTMCADHGVCSPLTGECVCAEGWQGESCEVRMSTTTQAPTTLMEELLTTTKTTSNTNSPPTGASSGRTPVSNASAVTTTTAPLTSTSSSISTTLTSTTRTTSTSTLPTTTTDKPSTTETSSFRSANMSVNENLTTKRIPDETGKITKAVSTFEPANAYNNVTVTTNAMSTLKNTTLETMPGSQRSTNSIYNRTEPSEIASTTPYVDTTSSNSSKLFVFTTDTGPKTTAVSAVPTNLTSSTQLTNTPTEKVVTARPETTRRLETSPKTLSTQKFKPKEIWIRPTQKGEANIIDYKIKSNYELTHSRRFATKKEIISEYTTPRTIIVSIIPTSVSYAVFKKIALTTSAYVTTKNATANLYKTYHGLTTSMAPHTSLHPFIKKAMSGTTSANISSHPTNASIAPENVTTLEWKSNLTGALSKITAPATGTTNSVTSMEADTPKLHPPHFLTTVSTSANSATTVFSTASGTLTAKSNAKPSERTGVDVTLKPTPDDMRTASIDLTKSVPTLDATELPTERGNAVTTISENIARIPYTKQPATEDETFHILTEPEHITAVIGDAERGSPSTDLVSVVGIAGGVAASVITVALLIVLAERRGRPRRADGIRAQVTLQCSEAPPPYARSVFRTPLPEPPPSDRCHYQPISTLDRNLKQFMRPVVVQNISPIMLENFRGILECHYDHLPRRDHDFGTMPSRFAPAPSMSYRQELRCKKSRSVYDSTIEALKCEAKLDIIDPTTSEPLYAEIPCWRPPSEHAIEVLNLNGEAMTEL